jgi:hypothetical protein
MNTTFFRQPEQPLTSNGFPPSSAPNRLRGLNSTQSTVSIQTRRELYHAQGYVWLKGFFKRDEVLEFRRRFFDAFEQAGMWMQPGASVFQPIFAIKACAKKLISAGIITGRWMICSKLR